MQKKKVLELSSMVSSIVSNRKKVGCNLHREAGRNSQFSH